MQRERPFSLFARTALTHEGWQNDVLISIDERGHIIEATANTQKPNVARAYDLILPSISNVHSHAFQRAMAGLTEISGGHEDNFWSWRQVMYMFKQYLTPDDAEIIAQCLYIDLLKQGYTSVGEFHYLHHDADGKPYANPAEMSERMIAAAESTGIHLAMLPVYYETSNFGGIPADEGQKRFVHTTDGFFKLLERLNRLKPHTTSMTLGIAPHSLRAVPPESLHLLLQMLADLGMADSPVHIHVSEQKKEVDDCLAWSGLRPVEWLMNNAPVSANWCLIHATHSNAKELRQIAESNAIVGLCPTTEANLGDGIFPADHYMWHKGRFAIGSDSNVCVSPWEEMRQMEYAQRLDTRRRTVLCSETFASVGRTLFEQVTTGGAQALGITSGRIAPGYRADLLALSMDSPLLSEKWQDQILDTLTFILPSPPVTHVWVAGRPVVENGVHRLEAEANANWKKMVQSLSSRA